MVFLPVEGKFIEKLNTGATFRGVVNNCMGNLNFELIDSVSNIIVTGRFTDGLDLLKDQVTVVSIETGDIELEVSEFFKPVAEGRWIISRLNGEFVREMVFKKGIIVH